MGSKLTPAEVLVRVPQQEPFRFIDEILEVDAEHVVATYTWREDSDFYRGHFPGDPVTPGVLLVESMAQASVCALGAYLLALDLEPEEATRILPFFADAEVEFTGMVKPGQKVRIDARKVFWRRLKLRCQVEMSLEDGSVVCSGTLSGVGVKR